MPLSPVMQIGLAFVVAIVLFIFLQVLPSTRLNYKAPLVNGFITTRANMILRLLASTLALFGPFFIIFIDLMTLDEALTLLLLCPIVFGLLLNPELTLSSNARLVITKSLISHTATLHLREPYQDFDRKTYQELLQLVTLLPQYGIEHIRLDSPMFYHASGELRSMTMLEKGLNQRGARFIHSPAGRFDCLLGKISMLVSTSKQKKSKIHHISLFKWHQILINL